MLMVLWTHGTCSLGAKLWAVIPPFQLFSKKTLPDFVPRFHSCPRERPLGALPEAKLSSGVLQTAVSRRRPRWNSVLLWAVDPECRINTRSVFGLWTPSVGLAIQHQDSIAAVGDLPPFPSLRAPQICIRDWCEIVPHIAFCAIGTARP